MNTLIKLEEPCSRLNKTEQHETCPVCGTQMQETDRLNEGNYTYIWLTCIKHNCDGQWLQKKPKYM
jgi:hypothetical protein